jgi:predicted O-methyltransferase YrrM
MQADRIIRKMLGVKSGDSLPFKGWRHSSTRADLHKIFAELGYTKGAESGVASGRHAKLMFEAVPGLHLTLVDPWRAYFRYSQRLCDERYAGAMRLLEPYNKTVLKMTSLEASQQVDDGSLDFVYIDGDHRFDAVMLDLVLWAPKVRRGGIVAGHDAYFFYQAGVIDAVFAYTRAHRINDYYVTWEKEATWFWVQRERHGS